MYNIYAAEAASNALQRDTFEVGIALLTAMSSSADKGVTVCIRQNLACMPCPYYITCACGLDSEFALQNLPFGKKI